MYSNYFSNGELVKQLYDCTFGNNNLHKSIKQPNKSIGMSLAFLSASYILLYFPFFIIMLKEKYIKHSYYMFSIFIAIINLLYLILHGLGSGYLALYGETYCTKSKLIIFIGSFSVALWGAYCFSILILLFHKCLALYNTNLNRIVFNRTNILGWLTLPIIYFIYLINFTPPLIFSTINNSWYFYPYTDYPSHQNSTVPTINLIYILNNYFTIIVPTVSLAFYVLKNIGEVMANKQTPKLKKISINHTFIQTIILTIIISLTSTFLIIFQFNNKTIIGILCEIIILTANGAPSILYLILSDKMRHDIYAIIHYTPKNKTPVKPIKKTLQ